MNPTSYMTGKRGRKPQSGTSKKRKTAHTDPADDEDRIIAPLGFLTNAIHPIFRRSNFTLDYEADFEVLTDSLQLASRLISRKAPLAVWHTLFNGEVKEATNVLYPVPKEACDQTQPKHWEFNEHPETLTDKQICVVEELFLTMADRIQFVMSDDGWSTTSSPDEVFGKMTVAIPRHKMAQLREVEARDDGVAESYSQHARMAFYFAVSLCHELAHVATFSSRDPDHDDHHYYFPDCAVSEDGYSWESAVFGGIIDTIRDDAGMKHVGLTPWPGNGYVANYLNHSDHMGVRLARSSTCIPPRVDGKFVSPCFLLPPRSYERLFTDRFWNIELPRDGPGALRFDLDQAVSFSRGVANTTFRALVLLFTDAIHAQAAGTLKPEARAEFDEWAAPWHQFLDDCAADDVEYD